MSNAKLADTDFTAERLNVRVIQQNSDPNGLSSNGTRLLLSKEEEAKMKARIREWQKELSIPRRPPWTTTSTAEQIDKNEREAFLDWRRHLATIEEGQDDLILTPFERNIEVWRQLWRVIERSRILVQIVDARNPLLYRCEDLERYVEEVSGEKVNVLLINKADYLTRRQR